MQSRNVIIVLEIENKQERGMEEHSIENIYRGIEELFGSGALMQLEDWLEDNKGDTSSEV
ncbi:hypothetical protein NVP1063O_125 [Vibrio phage 1.063.O._10N.261.45.C7]|nr:hypothetical protein NVP1063O_125 [Vibrio phage 1.063.O._10N.261.45.C7]